MSTGRNIETTLTPAERELLAIESRVQAGLSARRLWERCLSPQDRRRLGGDLESAYFPHRTAGMWARLRGVTQQRAVVDVAEKLNFLRDGDYEWLLEQIGETLDVDEAKSRAIAAGYLVLSERPREAYWNGEEIGINWRRNGVLWVFLWEVACHAKANQPVDRLVFGENAHVNVVANRKSRLMKTDGFPTDLGLMIEPVGLGTQQLMLAPERIRIFEWSGIDTLSEWYP